MRFFLILAVFLLVLPVAWPEVDVFLSGLFYRDAAGFFLADHGVFKGIHDTANGGSRFLAVVFLVAAAVTGWRRRAIFFSSKAWLFLFLALLVGPGLVANVGFKDHWGRARPREIVAFGGEDTFSPALAPRFNKARSNGSFVCGDGAFGFFFPAFAFVVPYRLSRRFFWGGIGVGVLFSFTRLAMGAHFFSDIVYAAFLMLGVSSLLYGALYGWAAMKDRWLGFFRRPSGV